MDGYFSEHAVLEHAMGFVGMSGWVGRLEGVCVYRYSLVVDRGEGFRVFRDPIYLMESFMACLKVECRL